jgi:hypothetical protein
MLARLRSSLTYANVVSTLCLILVVGGGGAYAKSKLINGTELKPRSVTATKIKKHSLTNTEVDVKKLGRVADAARLGGKLPSAFAPAGSYLPAGGTAANANALGGQPPSAFLPAGGTAANANALGGQPPSAYLPAGRVVSGSGGPGGQLLFTYPPLGLTAKSGSSWNVVVFTNAMNEQVEVSRSSTVTIQQVAANSDWTASPRLGAVVETYVFRSVVRPTVALVVTCGFDSRPDIVNCAGIGIG